MELQRWNPFLRDLDLLHQALKFSSRFSNFHYFIPIPLLVWESCKQETSLCGADCKMILEIWDLMLPVSSALCDPSWQILKLLQTNFFRKLICRQEPICCGEDFNMVFQTWVQIFVRHIKMLQVISALLDPSLQIFGRNGRIGKHCLL